MKTTDWKLNKVYDFKPLLQKYVDIKKNFTFLQIGSNDGFRDDPLNYFVKNCECTGVLVEPVLYLFNRLKQTYSDKKNLFFENVAVSDINSTKEFYCMKENNDPKLPKWYNGLSSFKLDVILKHKASIPRIEEHIVKIQVPTATVSHLLTKYNFNSIDIIHIDAEGYDFEIIKTIDFDKIHPDILQFEHKHLSKNDFNECLKHLNKYDYVFLQNSMNDTLCYSRKLSLGTI
jgi:FkbM family methyltransferase